MQADLLWEHYNARGLSPEMVARSFVAPAQFKKLAAPRNSVVLGPRGSGKTTMLRMLDPQALSKWDDPDGRLLRKSVGYIGVFVPVDTAWVGSLGHALRAVPEGLRDAADLTVYSLAVARSIVDIMIWRCGKESVNTDFSVVLPDEDRKVLIAHLLNLWLPGRTASTLLELRLILTSELATLPRKLDELDTRRQEQYLRAMSSPTALAAAACDGFNSIAKDSGRTWALLCDELEIAPAEVKRHLFSSLRATSQPILLKLALTPAFRLPLAESAEHPVPTNDYDPIQLSNATRGEGTSEKLRNKFCLDIWAGLVSQSSDRTPPEALINAHKAFETPRLARPKKNLTAAGNPRTTRPANTDDRLGENFRVLDRIDQSFSSYMRRKGVDVNNLAANPDLLDSVVRKVRPIVDIRSYYFTERSDGMAKVSRTALMPYCGADRLFAISEAHPRWLKSTLSAMLFELKEKPPYVSLTAQNRELQHAVTRIVARLRSIPNQAGPSTYTIIERIGKFFADQVLGSTFNADPILSFTVDADVSEEVIGCLSNALYIGALVPMSKESEEYLLNGLLGGRFRLSNWLAPHFKLPLVAGKAITLTNILGRARLTAATNTDQLTLGLVHEPKN